MPCVGIGPSRGVGTVQAHWKHTDGLESGADTWAVTFNESFPFSEHPHKCGFAYCLPLDLQTNNDGVDAVDVSASTPNTNVLYTHTEGRPPFRKVKPLFYPPPPPPLVKENKNVVTLIAATSL